MDLKLVTDRLNAIKRIFLFSNTLEEFAAKVGVPSLANNNNFDKVGADKRKAIFESLNEEYQIYQESSESSLEDMLQRYECTSVFYTTNELSKQPALSEKENILKLMKCFFFTHTLTEDNKLNKFILEIYDPENDKIRISNLDLSILLLLLYKIIPTYQSKKGAIDDINADYLKVKDLLNDFHNRLGSYEVNLIQHFWEERLNSDEIRLNRLSLITLFEDTVFSRDLINYRRDILETYRYFDIDGIWIDKIRDNVFYEFLLSIPGYTMMKYEVTGSEIKYTKFSFEILLEEDGHALYTTHPRGRARFVLDQKVGPLDHSIHDISFDDYEYPTIIRMKDRVRHPNYDFCVNNLYRATEEKSQYLQDLLESLKTVDAYEDYKTEYIPDSSIFAITKEYIYIIPPAPENHFLYKIPRNKYIDKGILNVNVDDTAGVAVIMKKGPYIGFEELGLYIDISSDEKIQEAEIEIVGFDEIR